jgi:hypothetical protein
MVFRALDVDLDWRGAGQQTLKLKHEAWNQLAGENGRGA